MALASFALNQNHLFLHSEHYLKLGIENREWKTKGGGDWENVTKIETKNGAKQH